MLNGKFFTGLPPKMIDRGNAGGRNRLESHLFWPDDTKTDTAHENRIKRRNSVQLQSVERPLYEKQNSAFDDVDTRKRFSKEFSQSSIQFHDNLSENNGRSRRSMLRNSAANKKMDIAEKPTNTKLELPDNVVNEAYTAAKKKQAYTSKIEFYDYANDCEEQNKRNNLRKPKMDMNDKREMELNSKNSPKLQMKRDVRSLSEEKEPHKINNHEVRNGERSVMSKMNDNNFQMERFINNEEDFLHGRRSVEPRMHVSPKSRLGKANNNHEQRFSCERENYREPIPFPNEIYRPKYYDNVGERGNRRSDDEPSVYDMEEKPQRIIRNNARYYYNAPDDRHYSQDLQSDVEIRQRMRNFSLKAAPQRRQYFPAQECYDDESTYGPNDRRSTPTNHGSSYPRYDYNDSEDNEVDLPYKNYNNTPQRFSSNKPPVNKINNQLERETVASPSPASPIPSDAESSISTTKSQKHLRSSLCFNNGEIIAENDATTSPTSSHKSTHRRNARSSATQRVSVGLPD